MARARTVLVAAVLGLGAIAVAGCTAAAPAPATHSPSARPSPQAAADTTPSYAEPAASTGDLLRLTMGAGASKEVSASTEVNGDIGDTSVLFGCTGQSDGMGYKLYVDGALDSAFTGASCNGQSFKNTGILGLQGKHRVAITITGVTGEMAEAYAVLVRGN